MPFGVRRKVKALLRSKDESIRIFPVRGTRYGVRVVANKSVGLAVGSVEALPATTAHMPIVFA